MTRLLAIPAAFLGANQGPENIASIEPRPLKVGDRVKHKTGFSGTIRAIEKDYAWVLLGENGLEGYTTSNISTLTRIGDA